MLDLDVDGEYNSSNNNKGGSGARRKTGRGTLTDLRLGVVTAPVLYAARLYTDQLNPLIESKFKGKRDVKIVIKYLRESDGVLRTQYLARVHVDLAVRAAFELVLRVGGGGEGVVRVI